MKKILLVMVTGLVTGGLSLAACTGPAPSPGGADSAPKATPELPKAAGSKWDAVVAGAQKEGTVSVYTTWAGPSRVALVKAFKDRYGINAEFTSFGRGAEFIVRAQAEKAAGINNADVYGFGSSTLLVLAKPAGLLGAVEPVLMLPEVTNGAMWRGGAVPFLDKDRRAIGMSGNVMPYVSINTELIDSKNFTSYKDLLKPEYKGKVTMNDPTITGAGSGFLAHLAYHIWSEQEAIDFVKQLIGNGAQVMRDQRLQAEWMARGRNPVALALDPNSFAELLNAGAPIARASLKEGVLMATGDGSVGLPTTSPHPNAAAVFLNWLLSKEGQSVYYKGAGAVSKRLDVPPEGFNPNLLPGPQEKLFTDAEEFILKRGALVETARKALAGHIK